MGGQLCMTFFLVLCTQGQTFNVLGSQNKNVLLDETTGEQLKGLGETCNHFQDCSTENSHCNNHKCTCDEGLVKSHFQDHDACVPETVEYNVEHKYDVDWNDQLLDTNSKKYKELTKPIVSAIKNLQDPLLVDYMSPAFEKTEDSKVKSVFILILPNTFDQQHGIQKRSIVEHSRQRRFLLAGLLASLQSIPGVSSVVITSNGHLNDPCDDSSPCTVGNSVCSSTCGCDTEKGYLMILPNTTYCYPKREYGGACEEQKQCYHSSQECAVTGYCDCLAGTFAAQDAGNNYGCYTMRTTLGEKCTIKQQCTNITYATCNDVCACGGGYGRVGVTNTCEGILGLNAGCQEDTQCSTKYAVCSSTGSCPSNDCSNDNCPCTCSCPTGYRASGSQCLALLGSSCSSTDECSPVDSECNNSGECSCVTGTEPNGDTTCQTCPTGNVGDSCSVEHCPCTVGVCVSGTCKSGVPPSNSSSKCPNRSLVLNVTHESDRTAIKVVSLDGAECKGPYSMQIKSSDGKICYALRKNVRIGDENFFDLKKNSTYRVFLNDAYGKEWIDQLESNSNRSSEKFKHWRPALSMHPFNFEKKITLRTRLHDDYEFNGNYMIRLYVADCKVYCYGDGAKCNMREVCPNTSMIISQTTRQIIFKPLEPGYYCVKVHRDRTVEKETGCTYDTLKVFPAHARLEEAPQPPSSTISLPGDPDNTPFLFLLFLLLPLIIAVWYYFRKGSPGTPSDTSRSVDPFEGLENFPPVSVFLLYLRDSDRFNNQVRKFREILTKKVNCQVHDLFGFYDMMQQDPDCLYSKLRECTVINILSTTGYETRNGETIMDHITSLYYRGLKAVKDRNGSILTVRFENITEPPPREMLEVLSPDRIYLLPKHTTKLGWDLHGKEPKDRSILERDIESIWSDDVQTDVGEVTV